MRAVDKTARLPHPEVSRPAPSTQHDPLAKERRCLVVSPSIVVTPLGGGCSAVICHSSFHFFEVDAKHQDSPFCSQYFYFLTNESPFYNLIGNSSPGTRPRGFLPVDLIKH